MGKGIKMIVMMQLLHRFHDLPEEYRKRIEQLSEQKFEQIGKDIFAIEKIEDLEKYFQ